MKAKAIVLFHSRAIQLGLIFIVLAFVVWIARFSQASDFGIYEDDWTIIPRAIEMSFSQLLEFIFNYVSNFLGQGRPLHHSLIYFFSFVGWRLGELGGIYFIGYLIVTLNTILFYLLLKRLFNHQFGFVGAIAFSLYSADTTQAFLTHSLGLQPSLTFFLIATHSYLSRKYLISYLMIFIGLLTYETPFLLFVVAPLFGDRWNRRLLKRLLVHLAIMAVIFTLIYFLRVAVGEGRVSTFEFSTAFQMSMRHVVQGPIYSIGSYFHRARQTYWVLDDSLIVVIALSIPIFFSILFFGGIDRKIMNMEEESSGESHRPSKMLERIRSNLSSMTQKRNFKKLLRLAIISVILLFLAYPLTFTSEPDSPFGRITRNHFAAVVGNSMFVACVWMLLIEIFRNKYLRIMIAVLFALVFSIMVGFGQVVQRDYAVGWKYQQEFWSDLLELIPDANEGAAIIVDPSGMKEPIHILANTWNMPRVLERIFIFPDDWDVPPSAYKMELGWLNQLHTGNGTLTLDTPVALTPRDHIREVTSEEMILIVTDNGVLARQNSPIMINGSRYPLKAPSDPIIQTFSHRPFYDVLIPNSSD
jgi:hypothetical protein